ncbi:Mitosis inhibitor protein kinase mik1 [Diaporthe eres]|nr:Mitosis inhibitor protein kinase mik1 [Diaporthe eres]
MSYLTLLEGELDDFLSKLQENSSQEDEAQAKSLSAQTGEDHALRRWNKFWQAPQAAGINSDQIWIDLCEVGPKRDAAIAHCKAYLFFTATKTMRSRVSTGPQEREAKRSYKQASSLISLWKSTVMIFNKTVLFQKRRQDPNNAGKWNLKFGTGIQLNRGSGPISELIRWIGANAQSMGLSSEQSFVKKEATSEDIALLLQVLWRSADLIAAAPLTRVSFHLMLLLGAVSGTRPGVLTDIRYRDISVELVRAPETGHRNIVAHFKLRQNKQKANTVYADQKHLLEFSLVLHSLSLFCPVSLVVARALAADAFRHSFTTLHELLNRPLFDKGTNCISLPWKEELLECEMFPISYVRYWSIWRRTTIVAGYSEDLRPYAVRVGAGSRLDDTLTPALRNHLLSHTTAVYERSYQARHVRENLSSILAPETAREGDDDLFRLLRQSSLRCDRLAPTEASVEDQIFWDKRKDISALHYSDDPDKHNKIRAIKLSLNTRRTREIREQYFDAANTRRALGNTANDLQPEDPTSAIHRGTVGPSITSKISSSLKLDSNRPPDAGQESAYIDLLLKYLNETYYGPPTCFLCPVTFESWNDVWKHSDKQHTSKAEWPRDCPECQRQGRNATLEKLQNLGEWCAHVHEEHAPSEKEPFRCLLGCRTFRRLRDLSNHWEKDHDEFWALSEPFPCPECERLGISYNNFTNAVGLRQHLASYHRTKHLPPMNTKLHGCLLCPGATFSSTSALSCHTTRVHVEAENKFKEPFPCPECQRIGQKSHLIHGIKQWCYHVTEWHGSANAPHPPASSMKRCLLCNASVLNEKSHFSTHLGKGQFDAPFPCPECVGKGMKAALIEDAENWKLHCASIHGEVVCITCTPLKSKRKQKRCLICDRSFAGLAIHVTRVHEKKAYFDVPFHCPECARTENAEACICPLIDGKQAWQAHCASVHPDSSPSASSREQSIGSTEASEATKGRDGGEGMLSEGQAEKPLQKKRTFAGEDLPVAVTRKKQRLNKARVVPTAETNTIGPMTTSPSLVPSTEAFRPLDSQPDRVHAPLADFLVTCEGDAPVSVVSSTAASPIDFDTKNAGPLHASQNDFRAEADNIWAEDDGLWLEEDDLWLKDIDLYFRAFATDLKITPDIEASMPNGAGEGDGTSERAFKCGDVEISVRPERAIITYTVVPATCGTLPTLPDQVKTEPGLTAPSDGS